MAALTSQSSIFVSARLPKYLVLKVAAVRIAIHSICPFIKRPIDRSRLCRACRLLSIALALFVVGSRRTVAASAALLAIAMCMVGCGSLSSGVADVRVSVSPKSVTMFTDQTQQFTASVMGPSNTGVTWSATAGSIDVIGLYKAPTVKLQTNVVVRVTSNDDPSKSSTAEAIIMPVNTQSLEITTGSPLPQGQAGAAYSETFTATGGTTPYNWTILAGVLPPGLTMNTIGVMTGTPTAGGTFTFTVAATDADNKTVPGNFSLTMNSQLLLITTGSPLPAGQAGSAYSEDFAATGGTAPYIWSISAGTPPPGSTMNFNGIFAGTPTSAGSFTFAVTATDADNKIARGNFSVTVNPPPLQITTGSSLLQGQVGSSYSETFAATGGTVPYIWSIATGAPPPGITLSSNGILAGVPTLAGSSAFTITVMDADNNTALGYFNLRVSAQALQITSGSPLPQVQVGNPYSVAVAATGGTAPYVWSISGGTPPPGITMNASGVLAGTPTSAGTFAFTFTVTDADNKTALGNFSLTVIEGAMCGPQNGYDCFVQDTGVHNYALPGPNWGPNICDWTSTSTVSNCGNLVGANTVQTPTDFGNAMVRCTDANTVSGHPGYIWTTYDAPSVNAWNVDDTAVLLKVTASGTQYLMGFNPSSLTCTMVTNGGLAVTFNGDAWFSHRTNNLVYWFDGTNQTQLKQSTVNLSTGLISTSILYDFNNSQCLTNSVNGYTGGSFPEGNYWHGTAASSLDDSAFSMAFSTLAAQGTGMYLASWTAGQAGCDLWNTATNVVTQNGILVGTVSDAPWGGANGGKFDKMYMHAALQTPNPAWVTTTTSPNTMIYGSYNDGNYFWQHGTTNVQRCGIGAPRWLAGKSQNDGDRVSPSTGNVGGYIYEILNGVGGVTGPSAPIWNQTTGGDTSDNGVTWHNIGLGAAAQFYCDGHGWTGYGGLAPGKHITYHSYSEPINPQTQLLSASSSGDQHFGNTNANTTDSAWIFVMSSDVGTGVNLLDPGTRYPSAMYNEIYLISPPYNPDGSVNPGRSFRRAAHNYNSGWHRVFDVQNGMCVLSQTGNFALCSTDGMGQFGDINGTASCNLGAPDWVKNATGDGTTTFAAGYKMFPNPVNGGNNGDYIYQIQSCSGACSSGATKPSPSWPQTENAIVVDGTISWVNTGAVQNCRADDVVIRLTR